jgi:two-component system sensor histidine kinase TtrS
MAAGLAHEINQPLAAIVNYAQGSSRRLRSNANEVSAVLPVIDDIAAEALPRRRDHPAVAQSGAQGDAEAGLDRSARSGGGNPAPRPTDTMQLGIAVQLERSRSCRAARRPHQIEQVILNLLRNAIDAMAEVEGERILHVRIVRVGDTAVELAVRDSGHGWRRASRGACSIRSSPPSPAARHGTLDQPHIIEVHQGRLWVAPNPDAGVTVRLTLPAPAPAATVAMASG